MDPFSALIISVLIAKYLVSYGVTDAISAWKGTESPRDRDRKARQERARSRLTSGGNGAPSGPTIGQAMSSRIAGRIANPPPKKPRGPLRTFMSDLWGDVVDEAALRTEDKMRDRRDRYEAQRRTQDDPVVAVPDPDLDIVDAEVVDEHDDQPVSIVHMACFACAKDATEGELTEGDGFCRACIATFREPSTAPTQTQPTEPVDLVKPVDTSTSAGTDTTTGEGATVTHWDFNPETYDPRSAQTFAEKVEKALEKLTATTINRLDALVNDGIQGEPVAAYQEMAESFRMAAAFAHEACDEFAQHEAYAQALEDDPTLRDTQAGRYLDLSKA